MNISMPRRVFFEIEQVLACYDVECVEEAAFFDQKGAIVKAALKTHYIFPGVIELLQYACLHAEIGFYSFNNPRHCPPIVNKLLKQAFGSSYAALKKRIAILMPEDIKGSFKEAVFVSGNKKAFPSELQNQVLAVPAISARDYRKPHMPFEKVAVVFWDNTHSVSEILAAVAKNGTLVVQKTGEQFTVYYSTQEAMIVYRTISLASHPDLFQALQQENKTAVLEQVALWGGNVDKLRKRKNRICYIAGILNCAITVSLKTSMAFPEALCLFLKSVPLRQYCRGLSVLKKINPSFELITYEKVTAVFRTVLCESLKLEYRTLLNRTWTKRKIFYDIDEVLSCHDVRTVEQAAFFDAYGMIIHAVRSHYIFPGVKELMKASFDSGLEVGFYSSASLERNIPYVKQLLENALGYYPEFVPIVNKIVDFPADVKKAEFEKYEKHSINKHKDLKEALSPGEELGNVLLVDDVQECASPGQIANMLVVPWTDAERMTRDDSYIKSLSLCITDDIHESLNDELESGTEIVLYRSQGKVEVRFLDRETFEVKKAALTDPNWIHAIHATKNFYYEGELADKIRGWIDSLNGKTTQICRQLNAVYYLTGLLFSVIKESEETGETLAKTLFKRQFRKIGKGKYKKITHLLASRDFYYHYGLKILRKYNPGLDFMTPEKVGRIFQLEITPDLKAKYEAHLNYGK